MAGAVAMHLRVRFLGAALVPRAVSSSWRRGARHYEPRPANVAEVIPVDLGTLSPAEQQLWDAYPRGTQAKLPLLTS